MMQNEYENAKKAYENYNLNDEYFLTERLISYIGSRIKESQKEIEKILKLYNRKEKYEEIEKVINEEEIKYKKQINITKREDGFVSGKYLASVGVIAVEAYNVVECVKYMIKGIKTRNAVIISDIEYEENDDKNLILLIIKEALKKFKIDENLIQIMPYEECNYDLCDKVIYTYERKKNTCKKKTNKMYLYIENESFEKEANEEYEIQTQNNNYIEIIRGNLHNAIDKINKEISKGAVIYTNNPKIAYKFINLVRSENVFVNATLQNIEVLDESKDEMLMNKKTMYELENNRFS